jgi:hypothetical protein
MRVGLSVPCYVDAFHPDVGIANTCAIISTQSSKPTRFAKSGRTRSSSSSFCTMYSTLWGSRQARGGGGRLATEERGSGRRLSLRGVV